MLGIESDAMSSTLASASCLQRRSVAVGSRPIPSIAFAIVWDRLLAK